jgi:ABC-type lipoprotein release transport system permease subunit
MGPSAANVPLDPSQACIAADKPFILQPFGSSSLALAHVKQGFNKVFRIAAMVVAVIAGIIMMGAVGRIIADSRRETAVFRAIGAKRLDIAQIYLTYSFMLSVIIAALAVAIGFGLASLADARYSGDLTVQALLVNNAKDLTRELHLYAFELRDMLYLTGFTLLAGLVSALLPLLRAARRNPIQDMRDDT